MVKRNEDRFLIRILTPKPHLYGGASFYAQSLCLTVWHCDFRRAISLVCHIKMGSLMIGPLNVINGG